MTLIIFFRNSNVVLEKAIVRNIVLLMIDKWKKAVDNNKVLGALLTDLSKAFGCICHDLLAAKLNAYGLSFSALVK